MQVKDPQHCWQLSFSGDWPTAVAFLGEGQRHPSPGPTAEDDRATCARLAAGNRTGQIFLWELPEHPPERKPTEDSGKEPSEPPDLAPSRRLDGHANGITHLRASPDGKTLISSSLDHTIRIWDVTAPAGGKAEVVLDTSSRERKARRKRKTEREQILNAPGVEVETVASKQVLEDHQGWVYALGITGDGRRLISGDDQCLSIVWDLSGDAAKPLSRWHGYDRVWVRSAALSPDGQLAFTCEYAGRRSSFDAPAAQARLWNAVDGTLKLDLLKTWTPDVKDKDRQDTYGYARTWGKLLKRGLVCAEFSPDGRWLAVGQGGETDTGKVHLVEVETGKIARTISGHRNGACDVKFSADSRYILSCGRDTTVRICQVADGKEIAALGKPRGGQFKDWMHALAVSPDQQFVAAADIAGLVHVWQLNG